MRERQPGVWEVRAFLGRDEAGRPRQVYRTVRGGKRVAAKELAALEAEANAGRHGKASTVATTLSMLIEQYLEHLKRLGRSPKTLLTYRYYATALEGYIASAVNRSHDYLAGAGVR